MSKFNLHPLSLALLGAITTPVFAETTTEDSSTHQLSTIVVSAAGFEQDIKNAPASITVLNQEDLKIQTRKLISRCFTWCRRCRC